MRAIRKRLTYANVMSSIAVFLVIGGASAFAASQLGKNSVGKKQLKSNSVTTAKIKKNAVTAKKIAKNAVTGVKIKNGTIDGAKINLATLGTVPSAATANALAGYSRKGIVRVTATPGATVAAAREAAPEIPFFSAGPFTVYAKCFTDTSSPETYGYFYIKTSENGAILDADDDSLDGDSKFLDTATSETERELTDESTGENEADFYAEHDPEFGAMAPNGTAIKGEFEIAVKNGTLAGGNGLYGNGDACLFAGDMRVLNG